MGNALRKSRNNRSYILFSNVVQIVIYLLDRRSTQHQYVFSLNEEQRNKKYSQKYLTNMKHDFKFLVCFIQEKRIFYLYFPNNFCLARCVGHCVIVIK